MSGALPGGWRPKRFWTAARVDATPEGYGVLLDDRPLRTPAKARLLVPTAALAEAIAAEWDAQEKEVAPESMPLTRAANSALDVVGANRAEVAEIVAAYGGSDLICYRAPHPEALAQRQAEAWDPLLAWVRDRFDAPLATGEGIVPVAQDAAALERLRAEVAQMTPFELAALHDLVALSGSLVIGLAAFHRLAPPEDLWAASRIDEDWQAGEWGEDEEASEIAARRKSDFMQAFRLLELLGR